eukprot:TRINITY_DN333_c0_g1_i3.p1 TRINITY_DN333_c0_g1~~TRINITY_DN333_c0_g1_i3.p1  ORF type:complete len:874 (-),score=253.10 TRINITY_DN333_c0_g1_i3:591-3212(-)
MAPKTAPKAAAAPKEAPAAPAKAPAPKALAQAPAKAPEDVAATIQGSTAGSVPEPKAVASTLGYKDSGALLEADEKKALKEGTAKPASKAKPVGNVEAAFGTSAAHATGRLSEGGPQSTKEPSKNIAKAVNPESPPSAMERLAQFGTTLFSAPQAAVDPPKAKAAAKPGSVAPAAAKASAAPKAAEAAAPSKATPTQKPGAPKGPLAAAGGVMPSQVIADVVSTKPQVAVGAFGQTTAAPRVDGAMTKPQGPLMTTPIGDASTSTPVLAQGTSGAAAAYASIAAPVLAAVDTAKQIPREGPATIAVARAIEASKETGKPAVTTSGKLPKATLAKKYQIVLVSAELAPYSKTGGLGEAMDGLSVALAALGHRVMVVTPRYDQYKDAWDTSFWSSVNMGGKTEPVHFFHAYKQKVDQVFVDHPCFLNCINGLTGSKLYGPQFGEDFVDNQARFAYFCKAALVAIRQLPLGGFPYGEDVVVVANDWHAGLVPMFMEAERELSAGTWIKERTKVLSLTHNAVYQGRFELEEGLASIFGISQKFIDNITFKMPIQIGEFNKKVACVNHLAASLVYCDRALTVSPTYALEVSSIPEKGVELQELYAARKCAGIVNGIKEGVSSLNENFLTKAFITCGPFTTASVDAAKSEMKAEYLKTSSLPASEGPMLCFIGRLDVQKGYDLMLAAFEEVLPELDMQVVIIGSGRADLVTATKQLAKTFPKKVAYEGWMGPERYGIVAASDYTIFTSRWEPCGLVQMECMRLGTVPVVAPTGGLRDTVEDGVTGFWTDRVMTDECEVCEESVASIVKVLRRVVEAHSDSKRVSEMRKAAMAAAAEFTWSNAALQYEAIFEEMGVIDVLPRVTSEDGKTVTLQEDNVVC